MIAVLWTGDKLVAADTDSIQVSGDGSTWTGVAKAPRFTAMAWSGGQFVGVGEGGAVHTSPDAMAWTPRASGAKSKLEAVTWTGTRFAAVGYDEFLTSTDGVTWTVDGLGKTIPYGVAWAESVFVVVGWDGAIKTSPDGRAWTSRNSGTGNILFSVTAANGMVFAAGADGAIIASSDRGMTRLAPRPGPSEGAALRWMGGREGPFDLLGRPLRAHRVFRWGWFSD